MNAVAQSAWAALLHRYCGKDDVVFGATFSGRPSALPGVECMVGLFINTLPVRVQIPCALPTLPWLQERQQQQLDLGQQEHTPLSRIQGWSQVPRKLPLFENLFVFENYPMADTALLSGQVPCSSLTIWDINFVERTNYPLTMMVLPNSEVLLRLTYDTHRFQRDDMRQLLAHYRTLLQSIVEHPELPVSRWPMLSPAQRRQLLIEWNRSASDYPRRDSIAQIFQAQAAQRPQAPALVLGQRQLTYQQLNHQANQLAHHLRRMGVGPDIPVGLCLERSMELVIGLLGILKAGRAYVPLDPQYPKERLALLLADIEPPLILTHSRLLQRLPQSPPVPRLCLDLQCEQIAQQPSDNPPLQSTAQHEVMDMSHYPKDYLQYAETHWKALPHYQPKPFPGHITLFRTQKQPLAMIDPSLGWAKLAANGLTVHVIPGTHEKILEEPNLRVVVRQLNACLSPSPNNNTPSVRRLQPSHRLPS